MNDHLSPLNHFSVLVQVALDLFRRPSPSGREDLVRAYVVQHLSRAGFAVSVDEAGNVLAERSDPDSSAGYPLLSFHMDQITAHTTDWHGSVLPGSRRGLDGFTRVFQPRRPETLALRPLDALEITNGRLSSRGAFVIGGDDKCGAAIALTLATLTTLPMKIVASVEEEIGCVGIARVDPRFFADVAYALVLDRRGTNDLVVSIAGQPLCQEAFAAAMMHEAAATGLLVYSVEGMLSDAVTLAQHIPNVVNLSVGYSHPHTVREVVSFVDLWRSYRWVHQALQSLPRELSEQDRRTSSRAQEAARLLCPQCRRLAISPLSYPNALPSDDLRRFVCLCTDQR